MATYQQMEDNARAKAEALEKVEILYERLRTASISASTCEELSRVFQSLASGDVNAARASHGKLCQKQW